MLVPDFVKHDSYLLPFAPQINHRLQLAADKEAELTAGQSSLSDFALGHHYFGLHKYPKSWVLREWAPHATQIFLIGEFSDWKPQQEYAFKATGAGNWELEVDRALLKHLDYYKLLMCWEGGSGERIPAWARRVVQNPETKIFSAQVWDPAKPYEWKHETPKKEKNFTPLVYEAHVGMATEEYCIGSWKDFRVQVLPEIKKSGYNTLQLMAVQEHPYYGSFGYHVSNFFAASSRFGTPDELKALIDEAHGMGLRVIMDMVHSHAVKNENEGISRYDGTLFQFFHDGDRGNHPAWDSRCFDYGKNQVLHFLLSNCKYWLEEFRFDGYRFDGITSMLFYDHGLGTEFLGYQQYFDGNQDEDAIVYLILANKLIREVSPDAITVAEEVSGMPGLATPLEKGGFGFDFRLAMGVPDFWIRTIKEKPIEFWHVGDMFYQLTNKRADEKTIHYAESHDQALVGDKTLIFWLMDKEMYYNMHVDHQNIVVENGVALHKMIRLITLATAGNGYLNFMGNEFGHPEWIDFPGQHNNWSYHYARRQWSLVKNPKLKYKYLDSFDKQMMALTRKYKLLKSAAISPLLQNISDQVVAFERSKLIFVFNFSPFKSYTDYSFRVSPGTYQVILDTDLAEFGGYSRQDQSIEHHTFEIKEQVHHISLYIPSLTGFVLKKI